MGRVWEMRLARPSRARRRLGWVTRCGWGNRRDARDESRARALAVWFWFDLLLAGGRGSGWVGLGRLPAWVRLGGVRARHAGFAGFPCPRHLSIVRPPWIFASARSISASAETDRSARLGSASARAPMGWIPPASFADASSFAARPRRVFSASGHGGFWVLQLGV